jgi:hypothetical protein
MISRISRSADKTTVVCYLCPDNISEHPFLAVSLGRALFAEIRVCPKWSVKRRKRLKRVKSDPETLQQKS